GPAARAPLSAGPPGNGVGAGAEQGSEGAIDDVCGAATKVESAPQTVAAGASAASRLPRTGDCYSAGIHRRATGSAVTAGASCASRGKRILKSVAYEVCRPAHDVHGAPTGGAAYSTWGREAGQASLGGAISPRSRHSTSTTGAAESESLGKCRVHRGDRAA